MVIEEPEKQLTSDETPASGDSHMCSVDQSMQRHVQGSNVIVQERSSAPGYRFGHASERMIGISERHAGSLTSRSRISDCPMAANG